MGPFTLGYERFPNFPPSNSELQSFGHASVSEEGDLSIALTSITGDVMYSKTVERQTRVAVTPSADGSASKCVRRS